MTVCELIAPRLGALFTCSDLGEYTRVRTPFLYPDGDVVDLYAKTRGANEPVTLTDLGESLRWLRMQNAASRRTAKQRRMVDDVCLTQGVQLFRGMLTVNIANHEDLPTAIVRLGEAAIRVSDIWFTFRTRAAETVTDEVAEFLTERQIPFQAGERIAGRSGKTWPIDFHTMTEQRSALTCVLASGSRASARGVVNQVVATWVDVNHLSLGPQGLRLVSLFDDTMDIWTPEDFNLLEPLSTVARWSRPDEYEQVLREAA
jgi:hypothetical protein